MCNCAVRPNVNGQPGYRWNNEEPHVRQPNPPDMMDGDDLLYDGAGRCGGGTDSHCHHFRLVKRYGQYCLLVRHGGGDERISLGSRVNGINSILAGNESQRYWALQMLYHAIKDAARSAREAESSRWIKAAAEKRVRTRKCRDRVKAWIEAT